MPIYLENGYIAPHHLYTFTFKDREVCIMASSHSNAVKEARDVSNGERWIKMHKSPIRHILG